MSNICIFFLLLLLLLQQLSEKEATIVKSRYANKKYSQALTSPFDEVVVVKVTFQTIIVDRVLAICFRYFDNLFW